jgi:hypothetical protein
MSSARAIEGVNADAAPPVAIRDRMKLRRSCVAAMGALPVYAARRSGTAADGE